MQTLVSVIIPVYNSIAYLAQTLDSVCAQTCSNLEILLIDDGSTDGSGAVCDSYAKRDSRIRVVHQHNAGLTAAWKRGVSLAEGEYVGFVDSDDWIEPEMYETLYQSARKEEADIVCCGIHHVFENGLHKPWDDVMKLPREVYTKEQIRLELFPVLINDGSFMGRSMQPNRVSKLVRRRLILENMHLCDDSVSVGEDSQFSFSIFPEADKLVVLPDYLPYYYKVNRQSMTGGYDRDYLDKIKQMKKQMETIGRQKGVFDFSTQITNDFICLCVLHIKGEIVRNKKAGYMQNRSNMRRICMDETVREALRQYKMPNLTWAERLFLFWMKYHWYAALYAAVRIYFRNDGL